MSANSIPLRREQPVRHAPVLQITRRVAPAPLGIVRAIFWTAGIAIACFQAWVFRYEVSADSISYLDMSDGVLPGSSWHRLINGIWSPLYPFLLGVFRRGSGVTPSHEIAFAHGMNVGFFAFAFFCFELFLRRLRQTTFSERSSGDAIPLPAWAFGTLAYSLFLWAALSAISLRFLRPDMLMSGFLYLAMACLLTISARPARWRGYLLLGLVLGVGYLAKEPMLPIAIAILVISLFVVEKWRRALPMAIGSLAIVFLIGSLYFVPLSFVRGKFTLGQSAAYNYLVNVDRAGAGDGWYLERAGKGMGAFSHPPARIFASPPAYKFGVVPLVTHPLRYDPSDWMAGVRPRFALKRQIGESLDNLFELSKLLARQLPLVLLVILFVFVSRSWRVLLAEIGYAWPVWMIGVVGCAMYVAVHFEPRYVGAFVVLFWCGVLGPLQKAPHRAKKSTVLAATLAVSVAVLVPIAHQPYARYLHVHKNADSEAAAELESLGVRIGDGVARISSKLTDFGIERIARVEVVSEVDFTHANEFWAVPLETQHQILSVFASSGAKAVIATQPRLTDSNRSDWKHLGSTQYWVWVPHLSRPARLKLAGGAGSAVNNQVKR